MRTYALLFSAFIVLTFSSCATRVETRSTKVTVVKVAPKHSKIVVVKGKRYHFWNGKYYKKTRRGYTFVRI